MLAVLIAVLTSAGVVGSDAQERALEVGASRVGYITLDAERMKLFTSRADGSDPRSAATISGFTYGWSPDATRLAYGRGDAVHVVDVFGAQTRTVVDGGRDLAWGPDGRRLAVTTDGAVWIVDVLVGDRHQAMEVPDEPRNRKQVSVTWAPAGERLAVEAVYPGDAGEDPPDLRWWLVDADGSGLVETDHGVDDWATGGDRYVAIIDGELVVVDAREPDQRKVVVASAQTSQTDERAALPAWSPDGRWIAYTRFEPLHETSSVRAVRPDGSEDHLVLADTRRAVWAPNGLDLVVQRQAEQSDGQIDTDLWAVRVDGTGARQLTSGERDDSDAEWLADGSAVVFTGSHDLAHNVYRVEKDGSGLTRFPNPSEPFRPEGREYALAPDVAPVVFGATARVMGATRVGTAVELSRRAFGAADTVVVATAAAYADALAGAPLAAANGGPVLLTDPDRLPEPVAEEVGRLGASQAIVLGTPDAVSDRVVDQLRDAGVDSVRRIGGVDRFATAAMVAGELDTDRLVLVEGIHTDPARGWPDAVAAAPLAAHLGRPVVFTRHDRLPEPTRRLLEDASPSAVTIVGGPAAVSEQVAAEVERYAEQVRRLAGDDRYATSVAVADAAVEAGMTTTHTYLVTGGNWPDALGAGAVSGRTGAVALLAPPDGLGDRASATWLAGHADQIELAVLIGGPAALSPQVAIDTNQHLGRSP